MRKRIRKTGEIIDVICFSGGTEKCDNDSVSFVDSNGNEIKRKMNYYWDLEDIDTNAKDEKYWEDFRNQAALDIFLEKLSKGITKKDVDEEMSLSVHYANHLTNKLIKHKFRIESEKWTDAD